MVADPDNAFPADFTLSLQPGDHYVLAGDTVTPARDFNGTLNVPVTVSDGQATSAQFALRIDVLPINDPPVFTLSGNVAELENFSGERRVTVLPDPVPANEAGDVI